MVAKHSRKKTIRKKNQKVKSKKVDKHGGGRKKWFKSRKWAASRAVGWRPNLLRWRKDTTKEKHDCIKRDARFKLEYDNFKEKTYIRFLKDFIKDPSKLKGMGDLDKYLLYRDIVEYLINKEIGDEFSLEGGIRKSNCKALPKVVGGIPQDNYGVEQGSARCRINDYIDSVIIQHYGYTLPPGYKTQCQFVRRQPQYNYPPQPGQFDQQRQFVPRQRNQRQDSYPPQPNQFGYSQGRQPYDTSQGSNQRQQQGQFVPQQQQAQNRNLRDNQRRNQRRNPRGQDQLILTDQSQGRGRSQGQSQRQDESRFSLV